MGMTFSDVGGTDIRFARATGLNAPKIGVAAVTEPGPCWDAVVMILNILGTVIANNVLTIDAWGGVVVAGGVVS